ncbi:MAG TPA: 50S ribosomal protein L19 [bacterium]|nr:50S ribosomal protein L19 [bacterium]
MSLDLVKIVDEQNKRQDLPELRPGLTVRVHFKVKEGQRERTQIFEGTIISVKGKGKNVKTITVRRVSFNVGVERIIPVNSKVIEKIEIVRAGKVRRAKLYYLRKTTSKKSKLKEIRSY